MKAKRQFPERPEQEKPVEMVNELMATIRRGFYPDSYLEGREKEWFQDQAFIKRNVVLWPAGWLRKRAVTLKPERYREILLEVFKGIKQHGAETVKFWPGYLMKCVQDHFKINEDAIYEEGKSLRTALDRVLTGVKSAQEAPRRADQVDRMAEALAILKARKPKAKAKLERQGELGF